MQKNILFRGCTRPAMFMGVPYTPFFIAFGAHLMLAVYINFFLLLNLPLVLFVLRMIAKKDEMIFRLWGLKMQFALKSRNSQLRNGLQSFSPNHYRPKPVRIDIDDPKKGSV